MAKFSVGDLVLVKAGLGARSWWVGQRAIVRAVLEEGGFCEVLFEGAEDCAFIEEHLLVPLGQSLPHYIDDLHKTDL